MSADVLAKWHEAVERNDLTLMKEGAVIVDVAVDQGGCVETIRPTTHENPTYFVEGILHYGVANMPGGVPRTSTLALTNATLPYALRLARDGWKAACHADPVLRKGLNVVEGKVVYPGVAEALRGRGHELSPLGRFSAGGGQAIVRQNDELIGASDHRKDGCALTRSDTKGSG